MSESHITTYLQSLSALYSQGITTEHSFRGALETLLSSMTGFAAVNEAQHIACGAPDLTLLKNSIPVGYVEAKDIGKNLSSKDYKNQFERYKKALDNLIITDYLTFQLFEGENFITEISIGKILLEKIEPIPGNFPAFIELIRTFSQYNGKSIASSKQLAEFMAAKTQLLSEVIEKTIRDSDESNTLHQQLKGFREVLLPAMRNAQFADIYAQTIAYGMFVARLQDSSNENFTRRYAETLIPRSNPFLRNLFHYIAYDLDENIRWLVDSLADMFNYVDITAIRKEFESKDKDPFLHFYEDFLTKYDKQMKNAMGAYYTPIAVVKFIVQAVDDILKNEFGISNGLADNSKVAMGHAPLLQEYHKVQILDPATGTGTFLAEVVRNIYMHFGGNAGMWSDYVKRHLIPRLNGFEIMMSPYTMAHLKLEMILQELGYNVSSSSRLQIYLTNSLENPKKSVNPIPFAGWLSNEAIEAEKIKSNVPVMVVLGNPPYSGESQNKGEWILKLLEGYKKEPTGGHLQEKNPKWLNDDYVKFIRFGQHFIEKNGEGILAYVNNHSFLDNPTFRGMRHSLLQAFDKIYILDLHGNAKKKETAPDGSKDENVFDIQQGVSINIFIKTKNTVAHDCKILHTDLFGKRTEKYSFLLENNLQSISWTELTPQAPQYFFVNKDFESREEYEKGFLITDLFSVYSLGILTKRDNLSIGFSKEELKKNLLCFLDENSSIKDVCSCFDIPIIDKDKWNAEISRKKTNANNLDLDIEDITYRPFDKRKVFYNEYFVARQNKKVLSNFKQPNCAIVIGRQGQAVGSNLWDIVFISNDLIDQNIFRRGGGTVFPLYLYHNNFGQTEKVANLNAAIVAEMAERTRGLIPLSNEQIFDYIYAVLHSPLYREKYKEFLKIDFPRIPYPANAEQFEKLAAFGEKLRHLHLMENVVPQQNLANFPKAGSNIVENSFTEKSGSYHDGKVWINGAQYFDNVPVAAWNFYIGGYQPAQKWLKDRKGRTLTFEDVEHYQKIIFVLSETGKVMKEINLTL
ncbi:MAG: N-6 DNA methylase [Prevotellaceae bacterium]|jgi:predicted helicase|nr:N-6 DNA methylase [Prevotellaceae bacterium]